MSTDELKIKIAGCFNGRGCHIDFDPHDHYGWLNIKCGACVFPSDIKRLQKFLYVANISATYDHSFVPPMPEVEIYCCYL